MAVETTQSTKWSGMSQWQRVYAVRDAVNAAVPVAAVALALEANISDINRLIENRNIVSFDPGRTPWWLLSPPDRKRTILDLHADGKTVEEICRLLQMPEESLRSFCRQRRIRGVLKPPAQAGHWHSMPTNTRVEDIRRLTEAGKSLEEIADHFKITKNSLLGFRFRNGMSQAKDRVPRGPTAKELDRSDRVLRKPEVVFSIHPLPPPETWAPIHDGPVADDGCAWPIEVDGVPAGKCGAVIHKRSYCAHHHAVAYRPASGRMLHVNEAPVRRRPMASAAAMAMAGVPARRMEVGE